MANENKEFDFQKLLENTQEVTEGDWGQVKPEEEDKVNQVLGGFELKIRDLIMQIVEQMKQIMGHDWQFRGPGAFQRLQTNIQRVVRDTISSIETTTPEEKSESKIQEDEPPRGGQDINLSKVKWCRATLCKYNQNLKCMAPGITVGSAADKANCLMYERK